jgi:hypothetical protein
LEKTVLEVSTIIPTLSPSIGCRIQRLFFLPINSGVSGDKVERNEMGGGCGGGGGRGEACTGFWWGNLRKRDHLEDPGLDGRIIIRWIFREWDVVVWIDGLDRASSGKGQVADTCECGNEISGIS